jgi:hypothetical protein
MDCEKWRAEYAGVGVEELVRTFEYKERPEVFEYYPQYYHKTDKVCLSSSNLSSSILTSNRTAAQSTSSHLAKSTSPRSAKSPPKNA